MCDKNSNINKAILTQVQEFANNQSVWSIHDITVAIRKKANAGQLTFPEYEVKNQSIKYNIPHIDVKNGFLELLNDGIFSEINVQIDIQPQNNPWREYVAIPSVNVSAPVTVVTPVVQSVPVQSVGTAPKVSKPLVEKKISNYLDNHTQQTISIEQIRAAIKSNGWTCAEIQDIVASLVDYNDLTRDPQYPSKSVVVV